jgi:hypothetical protein
MRGIWILKFKAWLILSTLSTIGVSLAGFVLTALTCIASGTTDQFYEMIRSPRYFLFEIILGCLLGTILHIRMVAKAKNMRNETVSNINKEIERYTQWCHTHGIDPDTHPMIIRLKKIVKSINNEK